MIEQFIPPPRKESPKQDWEAIKLAERDKIKVAGRVLSDIVDAAAWWEIDGGKNGQQGNADDADWTEKVEGLLNGRSSAVIVSFCLKSIETLEKKDTKLNQLAYALTLYIEKLDSRIFEENGVTKDHILAALTKKTKQFREYRRRCQRARERIASSWGHDWLTLSIWKGHQPHRWSEHMLRQMAVLAEHSVDVVNGWPIQIVFDLLITERQKRYDTLLLSNDHGIRLAEIRIVEKALVEADSNIKMQIQSELLKRPDLNTAALREDYGKERVG